MLFKALGLGHVREVSIHLFSWTETNKALTSHREAI